MSIFDRRAVVGFAVGAGVAVACTVAGASFAQQPAGRAAPSAPSAPAPAVTNAAPAPPLITAACANKKTGVIAIKAKQHKKCTKAEKAVAFATVPPPTTPPTAPSILAPDGSLVLENGVRFTSPNGAYVLVLTDNGLGLKGPGGTMTIDPFAVTTQQSRQAP